MATHAHKMVAYVAERMANELYEEMATDNLWYATHKDRIAFVQQAAPGLVEAARGILTDMLVRKDVSDKEKAEIHLALCEDLALPRGGTSVVH